MEIKSTSVSRETLPDVPVPLGTALTPIYVAMFSTKHSWNDYIAEKLKELPVEVPESARQLLLKRATKSHDKEVKYERVAVVVATDNQGHYTTYLGECNEHEGKVYMHHTRLAQQHDKDETAEDAKLCTSLSILTMHTTTEWKGERDNLREYEADNYDDMVAKIKAGNDWQLFTTLFPLTGKQATPPTAPTEDTTKAQLAEIQKKYGKAAAKELSTRIKKQK